MAKFLPAPRTIPALTLAAALGIAPFTSLAQPHTEADAAPDIWAEHDAATATTTSSLWSAESWSKETKYNATLAGSMAFITVWGFAKWDYGQRSPNAQSEGWFSEHTKEGGADKLGHFHLSYVLGNALPALYVHWGFDEEAAASRGLVSSLLIMSYMEIGDSFSDYGFSYEDFIMNTLGATAAYWLNRNPYWDERIAFRVDYFPKSLNVDFFTDYERTKYLAALRLDTVLGERLPYARFLDLQAGYFARGYGAPDETEQQKREWFVGIGLNFGQIAKSLGYEKTGRALHYWQPPGTSIRYGEDLNQ